MTNQQHCVQLFSEQIFFLQSVVVTPTVDMLNLMKLGIIDGNDEVEMFNKMEITIFMIKKTNNQMEFFSFTREVLISHTILPNFRAPKVSVQTDACKENRCLICRTTSIFLSQSSLIPLRCQCP